MKLNPMQTKKCIWINKMKCSMFVHMSGILCFFFLSIYLLLHLLSTFLFIKYSILWAEQTKMPNSSIKQNKKSSLPNQQQQETLIKIILFDTLAKIELKAFYCTGEQEKTIKYNASEEDRVGFEFLFVSW